jgi:hypothetical protein
VQARRVAAARRRFNLRGETSSPYADRHLIHQICHPYVVFPFYHYKTTPFFFTKCKSKVTGFPPDDETLPVRAFIAIEINAKNIRQSP